MCDIVELKYVWVSRQKKEGVDRCKHAFLQDSNVIEQEFTGLRDEALVKLDQSEQDLTAALSIRNRTMTLLQLTQEQLLDVESKHKIDYSGGEGALFFLKFSYWP